MVGLARGGEISRDNNRPCAIKRSLAIELTSNRFVNNGGADLPLNDACKANGRVFFEKLFAHAQATGRAGGLNLKGVFTRDRRPKMAAHALRKRWVG